MRLGEKLLKAGLITAGQLDDALKLQVIYGGRLGTNLVDLGVLELDALAHALAEQMGVTPALTAQFAAAERDPRTASLLPHTLAEQHQAVPLGHEPDSGRLAVAFIDPLKLAAVDEIAFTTGARVRAHVAPELTILRELERLYQVPCPARFRRVEPRQLDAVPVERPRNPTPSGPFAAVKRPVRRTPAQPFAAAIAPAPAQSPPLSAAEACARLAGAPSRDHIGDLILDHLRTRFAVGLIAIVRDDVALGWKGYAPGLSAADLAALAIPLGASSALAAGLVDLYAGPAPGGALDAELWRRLGSAPAGDVVVAPILLRGRAVTLVYAHGDTPSPATATDVQAVCLAASNAFARLIQSARKK